MPLALQPGFPLLLFLDMPFLFLTYSVRLPLVQQFRQLSRDTSQPLTREVEDIAKGSKYPTNMPLLT